MSLRDNMKYRSVSNIIYYSQRKQGRRQEVLFIDLLSLQEKSKLLSEAQQKSDTDTFS